jgi:hypothetical protein
MMGMPMPFPKKVFGIASTRGVARKGSRRSGKKRFMLPRG